MSLKRWVVSESDKDAARELSALTGIDPFCALLLTVRGITDPAQAEEFLSSDVYVCDPFSLTDMDKAVERIDKAIDAGEKIAIFGDYDCDGITATALLYSFLISCGADVICRLPDREEGYGMNTAAIDDFSSEGVSLIITVDNGISAHDEISYAKSIGIDTVVTDHHIPPETLPDAVAVVDPKRADDNCEFSGFAGVGVAYLLACAVNECEPEELLPEYGDLVALGTIADVMPVKYDNRAIIKYGLRLIKAGKRRSIAALMEVAGLNNREFSSSTVSFGIAPRINAAGRMLTPQKALDLLLCDDVGEAMGLARELNDLNLQRQKLESDIIAAADKMIIEDDAMARSPVLCVCGDNWHHGVLGIIAAKLSRKYCRPCLAFSCDNGIVSGSARSYKGVSVYDLISKCDDLLLGFGGHEGAAGLRMEAKNYPAFVDKINRTAHETYPTMPYDELRLDCKLNPATLSLAHAYSIRELEPFGSENEQPLFGLFNMIITSIAAVGKGNHLKLGLMREGKGITAMKFFSTLAEFPYKEGDEVDLAVTLEVNHFADTESLSIVINDIKPSSVDNERLTARVRVYENYKVFGEMPEFAPITRDDIAAVYKFIRARRHIIAPPDLLTALFRYDDYFRLKVILDILCESGLIIIAEGEMSEISIIDVDGKVDITAAPTYKTICKGEDDAV